ncbi:MAG: hypothetical protein ABIS47_01365, partial [Acidimicrobiales bacterium]
MGCRPRGSTIRLATLDDVVPLAQALASAFDPDPWLAWIVPADRHRARIAALQKGLLGVIGVPHGEVWLAAGPGGDLLGGALWLLAERPVPPEAWAQVAAAEGALLGERAPA